MNFKLVLKTLLIIAVLVLLVLMGMKNQQDTILSLPPILPKALHLEAAFMYVGFFGFGFLIGTLMMAGGKKGASRPAGGKEK